MPSPAARQRRPLPNRGLLGIESGLGVELLARETLSRGRDVNDGWIADRMGRIEASGIRKAFEMARSMVDPINLSIGLPDFDVATPVKAAAIEAIEGGFNSYTLTQGIPELRGKLQVAVDSELKHADRQVLVTSGTSGGLLLGLCSVINPGDEVIVFDPYFVMYNNLVALAGGTSVLVDTYPDFRTDVTKVAAALTGRTKCVIVNSPGNPTGVVASAEEMQALAKLCKDRGVLLVSDEVYRSFCYDRPFATPATWNEDVLVVDGFSKSHGMTGWRLGYAHGPSRLIQEMAKLQQFSYVCAPSMVQKAGVIALDQDLSAQTDAYRRKRDLVVSSLGGLYDLSTPEGAFYAFPRAPRGTATEFVAEGIKHNLMTIPGKVFSRKDTHFRISYAVADATLKKGMDVLRRLAEGRAGT
jgi:aspartate/methionine/tyrosine aminotransferase